MDREECVRIEILAECPESARPERMDDDPRSDSEVFATQFPIFGDRWRVHRRLR